MAPARVVLDDDAWAAVRVAYEGGDETVAQILARFGIQRHHLYYRIERDNWCKRVAYSVRSVDDVPPAAAVTRRMRRVDAADGLATDDEQDRSIDADRPLQTHGERLERLTRIIDRLLERMESNVVHNPNMTAQEQERAAKAVTSTMTAMERLAEIADPKKAPETSDGGKTNDSAEAERMRREIAERLERLSAKLLDGTSKPE